MGDLGELLLTWVICAAGAVAVVALGTGLWAVGMWATVWAWQ